VEWIEDLDWDEKYKQRFLDSFVEGDCEDSCWIWHGRANHYHPVFWNGTSLINVRKLIYEQFYKVELPKGKQFYSICENEKTCINPRHLRGIESIELAIRRFFKLIVKGKKDHYCWWWEGNKYKNGYGKFFYNRKTVYAHRFSFELHKHKIPEGLHVLHHCDFRECCHPEHLYLGDNAQNIKDRNDRNRQAKGEKVGFSKLKEYQVREILKSTEKVSMLAKQFNVTMQTIYVINNRKTWKHVMPKKDRIIIDRQPKGEQHYLSKLTEAQVKEILKSTEKNITLAKIYKVAPPTIYDIKKRKTWKHITDD
jgi:hypothetical protein